MSMTKKDFEDLAGRIRRYNENACSAGTNCVSPIKFGYTQLLCLAGFCASQNPRFDRQRFLEACEPETPSESESWVDSHSVNCHVCNKLVDERQCSRDDEGFDVCPKCVGDHLWTGDH